MHLDASLFLYSVDVSSPHHERSAVWVRALFTGQRRIALPWQAAGAFLRIATHPRAFARDMHDVLGHRLSLLTLVEVPLLSTSRASGDAGGVGVCGRRSRGRAGGGGATAFRIVQEGADGWSTAAHRPVISGCGRG
jgi:hypothetical protein